MAQHLGFVPRRKGKSVLVWVASRGGFARVRPILDEVSRRNPRLNVYCLCPSPALRCQLVAEGVVPEIFAAPARLGPWMDLCLVRSRAQLLLLADAPDEDAERLMERAAAREIPVAAHATPDAPDRTGAAATVEAWRSRITLPLAGDGSDLSARAAADALQPLIAVKRTPRGGGMAGGGMAGGLSSALLAPVYRRKYRCIARLDGLQAELGHPETILCLGNGPSSEDPRLADLSYDALFRVNHFWQDRGFLTEPQLVFTGLRAAIKAVSEPVIFAFQTREEEAKLMLKCLTLPRRVAFATAERLGVMDFGDFGVYTPTNGAVMLATAVALKPKRLIVAGMDLFQHPAGSYPGDSSTPNAYTVLHDRDTELAFILSRFERFEGELTILGEVLDGHWQAHRTAASEPTSEPAAKAGL
jgi:hypothetical protein